MKEEILSIETAEKLSTLKQLEKIIIEYDKEANRLTQKVNNLQKAIEVIKNTNKLLIQQKAQLQDDLDMLDERIEKAINKLKNGIFILPEDVNRVINILNGGDK